MKKGNVPNTYYDTTGFAGKTNDTMSNGHKQQVSSNQIQVFGIGDISSLPDQVKISIYISSSKPKADDSKNSVKRRYDYVIQCVGNLHLKHTDISESSTMKKMDGGIYTYTTTILVTFTDFKKCQSLRNLLEEKLDNSVGISAPHFSNSKLHLDQLRRKASVLAVENARTKAVELANHVGNQLLRPLWLREEELIETTGGGESQSGALAVDPLGSDDWESSMNSGTVGIHVRVAACFEMGVLRSGDVRR